MAHVSAQATGLLLADQPMLLPLTSAVYVTGKLASHDSIVLDIGTGYYAERTPAEGVDYCKRKVNMLRDNLDKIGQVHA